MKTLNFLDAVVIFFSDLLNPTKSEEFPFNLMQVSSSTFLPC